MRLIKVMCSTDWKGRPSHSLYEWPPMDRDVLEALMRDDIRRWQAEDVVHDEESECELENGVEIPAAGIENRVRELILDPQLPVLWKQDSARWEMNLDEPRGSANPVRIFAMYIEGGTSSISYHIV